MVRFVDGSGGSGCGSCAGGGGGGGGAGRNVRTVVQHFPEIFCYLKGHSLLVVGAFHGDEAEEERRAGRRGGEESVSKGSGVR